MKRSTIPSKTNSILFDLALHLLVLLFLYTGLTKLLDYPGFRSALFKSPPLRPWAGLIAWALPVAELLIAGGLILPKTRYTALIASAILLLILTAYLGWMIAFAPHLPCNCGGVIASLSWPQHLLFNTGFLLLNTLLLLYRNKIFPRGIPVEGTPPTGRLPAEHPVQNK